MNSDYAKHVIISIRNSKEITSSGNSLSRDVGYNFSTSVIISFYKVTKYIYLHVLIKRIIKLFLKLLTNLSCGIILGMAFFFKNRLPEVHSYDSSKWVLHIWEYFDIRLFVGITCSHFFNKSSFFNGKLKEYKNHKYKAV